MEYLHKKTCHFKRAKSKGVEIHGNKNKLSGIPLQNKNYINIYTPSFWNLTSPSLGKVSNPLPLFFKKLDISNRIFLTKKESSYCA